MYFEDTFLHKGGAYGVCVCVLPTKSDLENLSQHVRCVVWMDSQCMLPPFPSPRENRGGGAGGKDGGKERREI